MPSARGWLWSRRLAITRINPVTQQVGYAGIASPGNAPSAITVGAATTRSTVKAHRRPRFLSSARAVPRGTTASPSRTSSRLVYGMIWNLADGQQAGYVLPVARRARELKEGPAPQRIEHGHRGRLGSRGADARGQRRRCLGPRQLVPRTSPLAECSEGDAPVQRDRRSAMPTGKPYDVLTQGSGLRQRRRGDLARLHREHVEDARVPSGSRPTPRPGRASAALTEVWSQTLDLGHANAFAAAA